MPISLLEVSMGRRSKQTASDDTEYTNKDTKGVTRLTLDVVLDPKPCTVIAVAEAELKESSTGGASKMKLLAVDEDGRKVLETDEIGVNDTAYHKFNVAGSFTYPGGKTVTLKIIHRTTNSNYTAYIRNQSLKALIIYW